MKDSEIRVQCASHGETRGAFVCTHLVDGEQRGFNWARSPEDPDGLTPDAWCDSCDAGLDAAGSWTPEMEAQANIKLVCTSCYSTIREKNWIQDEAAWERFVDESIANFNQRVASFNREFRIGDHKRFDWNQDAAQLVFSNDGVAAVICDIAFVGGLSRKSNTWMWSWANTSHEEIVKSKSRIVRDYGEEHGFERLAGAYWPGEEQDGWRMTAIATHLLDGIGAYRAPSDERYLFMVVTAARWAT